MMKRFNPLSWRAIWLLMALLLTTSAGHTQGDAWDRYWRGDQWVTVKSIQYLLRAHGYQIGVDGKFGAQTEAAVKSFQKSHGLKADGIVASQTWRKLIVRIRAGSRGDAVRAAQLMLTEDENSPLPVDGIFGARTTAAVKQFQQNASIKADGIIGPQTWHKLVDDNGPQGD